MDKIEAQLKSSTRQNGRLSLSSTIFSPLCLITSYHPTRAQTAHAICNVDSLETLGITKTHQSWQKDTRDGRTSAYQRIHTAHASRHGRCTVGRAALAFAALAHGVVESTPRCGSKLPARLGWEASQLSRQDLAANARLELVSVIRFKPLTSARESCR
jgi:hypothetical protein